MDSTKNNPVRLSPFKITIDMQVHHKIMHWVRSAGKFEVSGMGHAVTIGTELHVVDAFLLPQENTIGSTEMDGVAIAKLLYELKDLPGTLSWWWHSHGNGNVFMSQTDHEQIEQFGRHGWMAATVFNTRGDTFSSLYLSQPFPLYLEGLNYEPVALVDQQVAERLDAEYIAKVRNFEFRKIGRGRRAKYHRQEVQFPYLFPTMHAASSSAAPEFYDDGVGPYGGNNFIHGDYRAGDDFINGDYRANEFSEREGLRLLAEEEDSGSRLAEEEGGSRLADEQEDGWLGTEDEEDYDA